MLDKNNKYYSKSPWFINKKLNHEKTNGNESKTKDIDQQVKQKELIQEPIVQDIPVPVNNVTKKDAEETEKMEAGKRVNKNSIPSFTTRGIKIF